MVYHLRLLSLSGQQLLEDFESDNRSTGITQCDFMLNKIC